MAAFSRHSSAGAGPGAGSGRHSTSPCTEPLPTTIGQGSYSHRLQGTSSLPLPCQGGRREAGPATGTADPWYGDCQVVIGLQQSRESCSGSHCCSAGLVCPGQPRSAIALTELGEMGCCPDSAKGRLIRANLACRLHIASHFWVAWSTPDAFCRFSQ